MCAAFGGAVILCSAFSPVGAGAQAGTLTAAVAGILPVPAGSLVGNRDVGIGGVVALRYAPAALQNVAVRLELSGLLPSSRVNSPANESPVVANGSSELFATAGPEFDMASWGGHFYTMATVGAARIWSSSNASSPATPAGGLPFDITNTREEINFAWSGGAGFVTRRSSAGVAADFGLRYYDLGPATYVTTFPGGVGLKSGTEGFFPGTTTVARHRVTFLAPSIGLSWRP
jgi:hypothetical protein